jgi:alpha-1,2-mannosyltransferase
VLCSRLVWVWEDGFGGVGGFLGSNAYVWVGLALLLFLPVGSAGAADRRDVADLRQEHRLATGR